MGHSARNVFDVFRRFAFALVAVVCLTSGFYQLRPGEVTPPSVVMLAAEAEAEHHLDTADAQTTVTRKRAGDPIRTVKVRERYYRAMHRAPMPRAPPIPHVEPRGPPVVA